MLTRHFVIVTMALVLLPTAAYPQASDYPSRPVRIVVGSSPGGTADTIARLIAVQLGEKLGGSFIVENRAGASGAIAAVTVAKSPADGYTLMLGAVNSHAVLPALAKNLQYDHVKDFAPVSLISFSPNLLLVHPTFEAQTVGALIELLRKNPGKYNYGSGGAGGSQQIAMEVFLLAIGSKMTHVPFNGSGQLLAALIANTVPIAFDTMTTAVPLVQGGQLRTLGISSLKRSEAMPDIPAISGIRAGFRRRCMERNSRARGHIAADHRQTL